MECWGTERSWWWNYKARPDPNAQSQFLWNCLVIMCLVKFSVRKVLEHFREANSIILPVNVGSLRTPSQLLYELTCRRVKNSNESPLWKQKWKTEQLQNTSRDDRFRSYCQDQYGSLSLMLWLFVCPAGSEKCNTVIPHEQRCRLGVFLC